MRHVILSGRGLVSALGSTVDTCADSMFSGRVPVQTLSVAWFDDPMSMLWYGIESPYAKDTEERFYHLIESAVSEALSGASLTENDTRKMGVFIGSSSYDVGLSEIRYRKDLESANRASALPVQMVSLGHVLGHLRRKLKLRGPDYTYGTACSASANAVLGASRMLEQGVIDHAIVIGLESYNLTTLAGFHSLQLLSEDQVRPFDLNRSGMVLGESCAAVVLSATDAVSADQTRIAGGASNCDTSSITATNIDGVAIRNVLLGALADAGVDQSDISGIKAHATASLANDTAEAAGLHQVFTDIPPVCAFKPYIGHTLGACGVAELVLFDASLKHHAFPATPGFTNTDPAVALSPVTGITPLPPSGRYLLNYFGFGGNNTVLVVANG